MERSHETPESARFLERLRAALARLPVGGSPRYAVAFSGGVDSTVLLAALAREVPTARLRALHIDHGLHPASAEWAAHCRREALALGIEFHVRPIVVDAAGQGIEAAARAARYAALAELLAPGEVLLTAHHGDDQLETILLRLLRGAGVRGLTGIAEHGVLGRGDVARPLLDFSRAEITAQAARWELTWIEDPANAESRFDRAFVRARVVPVLKERWPAAERAAVGLARRMAEAERLLEDVAERDGADFGDLGRLPCAALRALTPERRRNVLRFAMRRLGLPTASAAQLAALDAALALALERPDALSRVTWHGAEARIYREHLYLRTAARPAAGSGGETITAAERARASGAPAGRLAIAADWRGREGRLALAPADAEDEAFPEDWVRAGLEVRFRAGGERFTPAHHAHRKTLKHWFQENGIVPWMRAHIPLLYRGDTLVGVADLCVSEDARRAPAGAARWRAVWTDHPPIR